MKIQSNIRFPNELKRWDEYHLIHYYNIADKGEDENGTPQFEADFVIIKSIEEIDEAITRASLAPILDRMIVDNIQIIHHDPIPNKIKVYFKYTDASNLVQSYPDLMVYIQENAIPVIFEKEGVYIYLSVIYDQHRQLFNYFNADIVDPT